MEQLEGSVRQVTTARLELQLMCLVQEVLMNQDKDLKNAKFVLLGISALQDLKPLKNVLSSISVRQVKQPQLNVCLVPTLLPVGLN